MKKTFLAFVIFSMMFVCASSPALASEATATATLSWSLASGNILWIPGGSVTEATTATLNSGGEFDSDFSSTLAQASISDASAMAQIAGQTLTANAYVGPVAWTVPGFTWAEANASLYPAGTAMFVVNSTGKVTFNIDWSASYDLTASNGTGSYAHGISSVYAVLTRYVAATKKTEQTILQYISDSAAPGDHLVATKSNPNDYVAATFAKGDFGTLNLVAYAQVDAATPVPLPAGLWLLGTGLVGLVGIRRKTSSK